MVEVAELSASANRLALGSALVVVALRHSLSERVTRLCWSGVEWRGKRTSEEERV